MNLDRNLNADGKGKYALINLRKIEGNPQTAEELAAAILKNPECVEFGRVGEQDEFFVIKLKDEYAPDGLRGYGARAWASDAEYGSKVLDLARRSGKNSPFCKKPD